MTNLISQKHFTPFHKFFTPLLVISNFETRDRNSIFDMFEVLVNKGCKELSKGIKLFEMKIENLEFYMYKKLQ